GLVCPGDRPVEIDETAAAQHLLRGDTALDLLDMRKHLEIARTAWTDVDVAALAGDGYPGVSRMDQPCYAETCAGAEHHPSGSRFGFAAADLLHVRRPERDDGKRLSLEIVEHQHLFQTERGKHLPGPDDPVAIGQLDLVAIDRAGHGKHCGQWQNGCAVEDGGLDRFVDGREIRRLDDGELLRLSIG